MEPSESSTPYRIREPSNSVEVVNIQALQAENEHLRAQLQQLQ
jgi:hypothetical protein